MKAFFLTTLFATLSLTAQAETLDCYRQDTGQFFARIVEISESQASLTYFDGSNSITNFTTEKQDQTFGCETTTTVMKTYGDPNIRLTGSYTAPIRPSRCDSYSQLTEYEGIYSVPLSIVAFVPLTCQVMPDTIYSRLPTPFSL